MKRRQPVKGDLVINTTQQGDFKVALILNVKPVIPNIWDDECSQGKVLIAIGSDGHFKRIPLWCVTWCYNGFWKVDDGRVV
jgi:hypothetical protein